MPFAFGGIVGYSPTLEELLEDLGIASPSDFRATVLGRCKELYALAEASGNIARLGDPPHEFILCDSTDFYRTLVNLGYGNCALAIKDDFSPEVYFLLFRDKVPEQFHQIVAAHESTEYEEVQSGTDQATAHERASAAELGTAERLGLKVEYIRFLQENYPRKCDELHALERM